MMNRLTAEMKAILRTLEQGTPLVFQRCNGERRPSFHFMGDDSEVPYPIVFNLMQAGLVRRQSESEATRDTVFELTRQGEMTLQP